MRLKELRLKANLSQKEVAAKLQVAQNTYSNWENEKRDPNTKDLVRLAKFFGVSVDYLLENEAISLPVDGLDPEREILESEKPKEMPAEELIQYLTPGAREEVEKLIQKALQTYTNKNQK